jgi:Sporulation inhibitor A
MAELPRNHRGGAGTLRKIDIADEYLIEAYMDALRLKLTPDFIYLLETEMAARGLIFVGPPSLEAYVAVTSR